MAVPSLSRLAIESLLTLYHRFELSPCCIDSSTTTTPNVVLTGPLCLVLQVRRHPGPHDQFAPLARAAVLEAVQLQLAATMPPGAPWRASVGAVHGCTQVGRALLCGTVRLC